MVTKIMPLDSQKLTQIKEYCEEISGTFTRFGKPFEIFQTDLDCQYSVSFSILQIGEFINHLSDEFRQTEGKSIPWDTITNIRNEIEHNYDAIDLNAVWRIATIDIPALKVFCEEELSKARME